ncbi:hypothetical protein H4W32_001453 [Actinophytocola algeriensis]|uniref:Uncharacterized protein n=1 Tax=Actinophytocola algeriensis TaxID=1768010 RepID=A0A7W7QDF9_9PSEU|nr:hypothetical protein [Actinophytocola algeriensis]MBE1473411.1 hypothetical protein [Actinophytocola algeriensis]
MRAGSPISFWEFTRKGAVITAITIAIAAPYLWLRYFVLARKTGRHGRCTDVR